MASAQKARKTLTVTLSLAELDHEWLTAFAEASGKTMDDAASFGLSRWLPLEGRLTTEMMSVKLSKPAKRAPKKKTAKVLMFPTASPNSGWQ
jgi:hypothetical protein